MHKNNGVLGYARRSYLHISYARTIHTLDVGLNATSFKLAVYQLVIVLGKASIEKVQDCMDVQRSEGLEG